MFNVHLSSSIVQFSINGWFGLFLLLYFSLQLVLIFKFRVFPLHRTYLFLKTLNELKKTKPKHWSFTSHNLLSPISISKKDNGYEVFIRTKSTAYDEWTCDWVLVDSRGEIKSEKLSKNMKDYDFRKKSDIIQYNRNKNLKNLGL